jgi:hypothetical protein
LQDDDKAVKLPTGRKTPSPGKGKQPAGRKTPSPGKGKQPAGRETPSPGKGKQPSGACKDRDTCINQIRSLLQGDGAKNYTRETLIAVLNVIDSATK